MLAYVADPTLNTDRRDCDRIGVRLSVLAGTKRKARSFTILDISSTGCMVAINGNLALGEKATVEFPGGHVESAEVVWCRGDRAGLEFLSSLSKAALSSARLKSDHLSGEAVQDTQITERAETFDHFADVPDSEKLPRRQRMLINLSLVSLPWLLAGAVALAL